MLKVWGRANSSNLKKVTWLCEDIGLPYERIDAGMNFGVVNNARISQAESERPGADDR